MQIPVSRWEFMRTFLAMHTDKLSIKWPRLCSKVFQDRKGKRSIFSSFQNSGRGFDSHRPLQKPD